MTGTLPALGIPLTVNQSSQDNQLYPSGHSTDQSASSAVRRHVTGHAGVNLYTCIISALQEKEMLCTAVSLTTSKYEPIMF